MAICFPAKWQMENSIVELRDYVHSFQEKYIRRVSKYVQNFVVALFPRFLHRVHVMLLLKPTNWS